MTTTLGFVVAPATLCDAAAVAAAVAPLVEVVDALVVAEGAAAAAPDVAAVVVVVDCLRSAETAAVHGTKLRLRVANR